MKKKKQKKTWELTRHFQKWTQREENLLRKLYRTTLANDLAVKLERTEEAVTTKARRMGIRKAPERNTLHVAPRPYSAKEIKKLRQLWRQKHTIPQIAKIIGRSPGGVKYQIHKQIREFGLQKRFEPGKLWSKKEIAYLTRHYKNKSTQELSIILRRTERSIVTKAKKLNLSNEARPWTAKELNIVKRYYKRRPTAEIAEELSRTTIAVQGRAIKMGLGKPPTQWSAQEIKKLRDLWRQGYSKPQIVRVLGKDANAVANQITKQAREFGLQRRNKFRLWSEKDDRYLIRHYHKKTPKQIAETLGRTRAAVITRAGLLNLTNKKAEPWTEKEIDILKKSFKLWTTKKIANRLGRTPQSVWGKAYKLGLRK